jgi:hypothetical protein
MDDTKTDPTETEESDTLMLTARVPRELVAALDQEAARIRAETRLPVSRSAALVRVLYTALQTHLRPTAPPQDPTPAPRPRNPRAPTGARPAPAAKRAPRAHPKTRK